MIVHDIYVGWLRAQKQLSVRVCEQVRVLYIKVRHMERGGGEEEREAG